MSSPLQVQEQAVSLDPATLIGTTEKDKLFPGVAHGHEVKAHAEMMPTERRVKAREGVKL